MKPLTYKQLKRATEVVRTHKKFADRPSGTDLELSRALVYMQGEKINEPRDPREVLTEIGYNF